MDFANTERESFKEKFDKLKSEINQLRDEKLYTEAYQRRENLRFFGIKEEAGAGEDTREVLVGFLETELRMEDANQIEFQRVHRVRKRVSRFFKIYIKKLKIIKIIKNCIKNSIFKCLGHSFL